MPVVALLLLLVMVMVMAVASVLQLLCLIFPDKQLQQQHELLPCKTVPKYRACKAEDRFSSCSRALCSSAPSCRSSLRITVTSSLQQKQQHHRQQQQQRPARQQ